VSSTSSILRSARSAFALPLVLMASLALAVLITVLLERFAGQTRSVAAITRSYEAHHVGKGIHQLFEAWLRTTTSNKLANKLGENGLALTARLSEGVTSTASGPETLRLFLDDAQGSILTEVGSLPAEDVPLAEAIIAAAREIEGNAPGPVAPEVAVSRRNLGPLAVSIKSASPATLRAAVVGACGTSKADQLVAELFRLRDENTISTTNISEIANKAELNGDERARFLKAVSAEPSLWNVTAEISTEQILNPGVILRYKGLANVLNNGATSGLSARSVIRNWVREDVR
jgi:hypothetical protein